jgi:hypothetical protein
MRSILSEMNRLIVTSALLLASLILGGCDFDTMTPEEATDASVTVVRNAINDFVADNGRAPSNMVEIARYRPVNKAWNDGWGRTLLYDVNTSGVASLTSLGKDGRPGGLGQDADLVWAFALKDRSGTWIGTNWQMGSLEWLSHPLRPPRRSEATQPK